jgi:F420-dependent oxidoreductase-like protein
MIEIAIMIEGQNGLNWPRWQRIAQAVEDLGFVGLYRSDHFTNADPPDRDSLELWMSLSWLASFSKKLEFGPLVSPVSFRHPTMTARFARDVDDLSGGRLTLGLGAGWQAREHTNYGWDLGSIPARFARFDEGLSVVTRLLRSEGPVDFVGEYYHLQEATLLPRPHRPGGPPILIGGNGIRRTFPLVVRYADAWNGVFLSAADFQERNTLLDTLLREAGRAPEDVHRSLMTGCLYGHTEGEIHARANEYNSTPAELRAEGLLVGHGAALVDQLGGYSEAGVQRIMLQWLDLDDLDGLASLARDVLS